MRQPVSSAVLGGMLIVICDDGSVWELDPSNGWVEREPIPGTSEAIPERRARRGFGSDERGEPEKVADRAPMPADTGARRREREP